MKLEYANAKNESQFILTDFNCSPSQDLLKNEGLYKIIWCQDTSVRIVIDGYDQVLEKNQMVFCTPINVLEINKGTTGLISLVFNREFYCIRDHDEEVSCNGFLFFGSSYPPIISLGDRNLKSFSAMLHLFEEEFATRDHIQGEMLRTLLKRMLILSSRIVKTELPQPTISNSQLDTIRQFNILVEQHFRTKHQVSEYADLLFKSPKTLSNLFGKYSDKTPLKVINERILVEAKRLLLYSNKTAEEIAYNLNYKEPGHFSKFFKKNEGLSPIDFRRQKLGVV